MEPPREKVSCQGVSMSKVRCTSNPKPQSKYCGKHAGWGIHDAILARGVHVCSNWDTRRCSNEAGGAKQRCQSCRDTGNQGEASLREKKLAKARATLKDGEKTCYGKCCTNHLLSEFVSAQGTKTEHCQGCRASQDVREKRRKEKQRAQNKTGVVTERLQKAREYGLRRTTIVGVPFILPDKCTPKKSCCITLTPVCYIDSCPCVVDNAFNNTCSHKHDYVLWVQ